MGIFLLLQRMGHQKISIKQAIQKPMLAGLPIRVNPSAASPTATPAKITNQFTFFILHLTSRNLSVNFIMTEAQIKDQLRLLITLLNY